MSMEVGVIRQLTIVSVWLANKMEKYMKSTETIIEGWDD